MLQQQAGGVAVDEQGEHHGGRELRVAGAPVIDAEVVGIQGRNGINDKVGEVIIRNPILDTGREEHGGLAINVLESGSDGHSMEEGVAEGQEILVIRSRFSSRKEPQMAAEYEFPGFPELIVKSDRLLAACRT